MPEKRVVLKTARRLILETYPPIWKEMDLRLWKKPGSN